MPRGGPRPGSGRPKGSKNQLQLTALAKTYAPAALKTLVSIMNDPAAPHAARVTAANCVIDRGYGRPPQTIEANITRINPEALSDADLAGYIAGNSSAHIAEAPQDTSKLN